MTPSPRGAFPSPPLSRPFTADFLPDGRALDTTRGSLVLAVFHEAYTTASPGPNYGKRCREERDRQIGWAGLQDSARSHPAKSARVGRNGKEGLARTQGPGPLPDRSTQGSALGKGMSLTASARAQTSVQMGKEGNGGGNISSRCYYACVLRASGEDSLSTVPSQLFAVGAGPGARG